VTGHSENAAGSHLHSTGPAGARAVGSHLHLTGNAVREDLAPHSGIGSRAYQGSRVLPLDVQCVKAEELTRKLGGRGDFRVFCRVMAVVELLRRPEGKTLEFKRDLSSPDPVL